jgi:hypothetical protein
MLVVVRVWILLSALLVSAGWILSALHELNRTGYEIIFALAGMTAIYWQRKTKWSARKSLAQACHKFRRRFTRLAPLLFLALALMSLVGGSLYLHVNGDSNAYRIPRVWHWLGNEQWHWIRTVDSRMNVVGCGFEWLCTPLMLFMCTDRLIFLINWISYLMLPGLIFSVFTRLQVRPRVAWWWMWFLSAGCCFATQAGSDANDSFAAVYILAAVDLALRAHEKNSVADLWLSMLAVALGTGVKQTNIPLTLLWLVTAWPILRLSLVRPLTTIFVVTASALVSAMPGTILNIEHTGNWLGLAADTTKSVWRTDAPFWTFVGNIFCIPLQNLLPPFFPWAGAWNGMMSRFLQTPFGAHFSSLEQFGHLSAGISESSAGIGLGICVLLFVSILKSHRLKKIAPSRKTIKRDQWLFRLRATPWALLLLFMAKVGTFENARHLAPYYVFLFPVILVKSGHSLVVRQRRWQQLGLLSMLLTAAVLVVSRERPLFPAVTLTRALKAAHPQSKNLSRLWRSFAWSRSVVRQRNYFQKDLPPDEHMVGYVTMSGCAEMGLWLPFGSRRVERVLPGDTPEQLRAQGIHYVLVEDIGLKMMQMTIEQWLQRYDASMVDQLEFLEDPYRSPGHLYLVHLMNRRNKTSSDATS